MRVRQKGHRTIVLPISVEVLAVISERGSDEWLFPRPKDRRTGGGVGPTRRDSVREVVKKAVKALRIADHERLDTHSFRRAFVSHAARAGLPNDVTRRLTGHESPSMLAHYQKESVGDDLRAAQEQVRAFRVSARSRARAAKAPANPPASEAPPERAASPLKSPLKSPQAALETSSQNGASPAEGGACSNGGTRTRTGDLVLIRDAL